MSLPELLGDTIRSGQSFSLIEDGAAFRTTIFLLQMGRIDVPDLVCTYDAIEALRAHALGHARDAAKHPTPAAPETRSAAKRRGNKRN